ncbi:MULTISPECIES: PrgI family protein [unclassified Butyrivibrio]|uniref:PrgI family protein n=1 Tax=unclassified Butyrivibrio TaxID=2639466 RepID=UPI0004282930|nr:MULTISPECIES: PrgI family protein [unclassified Butyrivibrio]
MAYTENHCDLNKIKDKPISGFTVRQVVCFAIVILIDAPVYVLCLKSGMDNTFACLIICLISIPIFFGGTYEDVHGRYVEKLIRDKVRLVFLTQTNRPFSTDNRYTAIKKQILLEEKYKGFVRKAAVKKAFKAKKREEKTLRHKTKANNKIRLFRANKEQKDNSITA